MTEEYIGICTRPSLTEQETHVCTCVAIGIANANLSMSLLPWRNCHAPPCSIRCICLLCRVFVLHKRVPLREGGPGYLLILSTRRPLAHAAACVGKPAARTATPSTSPSHPASHSLSHKAPIDLTRPEHDPTTDRPDHDPTRPRPKLVCSMVCYR